MQDWPLHKRVIAASSFCLCLAVLVITIADGFTTAYPMRLLQGLMVAVAAAGLLAIAIGLITTRMGNYTAPEDEEEFERLVVRSERLARENLAAEPDEDEFLEL